MNVTDATTNSYSFSTIDISFPPAPMDVHTLTVNVSVAALNRHGEGPRSEPDTEVINGTYICVHCGLSLGLCIIFRTLECYRHNLHI